MYVIEDLKLKHEITALQAGKLVDPKVYIFFRVHACLRLTNVTLNAHTLLKNRSVRVAALSIERFCRYPITNWSFLEPREWLGILTEIGNPLQLDRRNCTAYPLVGQRIIGQRWSFYLNLIPPLRRRACKTHQRLVRFRHQQQQQNHSSRERQLSRQQFGTW